MIIVTKSTKPTTNDIINIGRQCETGVRQVEFDLSYLIETYGSGSATVVHQRSQDTAPYIVDAITQSGDTLTWTINNTDTLYDGYGQLEVRWTVNGDLAKTVIYRTKTIRSITGDTTIPAALQSWYDAMIDYIDDHSVSPEDLAEAVAEYIEEHPIEAPVMSVNGETGEVVLDAEDVGALPDNTSYVSSFNGSTGAVTYSAPVTSVNGQTGAVTVTIPVTSVNGQTGAVVLSIPTKVSQLQNDSGFGTYSKPSGGIPKSDLANAVQTSLGKADSALQSAPVSSVDGKTGAVTIIPTGGTQGQVLKKTSSTNYAVEWANESGAVSSVDGKTGAVTVLPTGGSQGQVLKKTSSTNYAVEWANESGGGAVTSVNSKTGAVVLDAGDLAYDSTETYSSGTVGDELSDLKSDLNGKLSSNQGSGNAGKWLTIANDGTVTASDLPVYSGGVS